jgi:uncharacterized membrane protein (DUF2068 family)
MGKHQPTTADIYGLRSVAVFELLKGFAALVAGILLVTHPHASFGRIAEHILHAFHIRRNSIIAIELISWARKVNIEHVHLVLVFVAIYVGFRLAEGWGLWHARSWAAWLGIANGVLYLPVEIVELFRHVTWLRMGVLVTNVIVVLYLAWELRKTRLDDESTTLSDRSVDLKKERPGLSTGL